MVIHNTTEDIVFSEADKIFKAIEKEGNPEQFSLNDQCRMDIICYVLNRIEPRYIVSNRGVARVEQDSFEKQQKEADIVALVYDGIKRVNHNMRPRIGAGAARIGTGAAPDTPVYNIPTIVGRLFSGINFSPMSGIGVELWQDGRLVTMKDENWQNPYNIVSNTAGTFTFWPAPLSAEAPGLRRIFEYSVKIEAPPFEPLSHRFSVPVMSEILSSSSFSMDRTFKLPDLYMFPPGDEED
ncbi:MAG: late competence development ComFB family protein [Treponema sp.]|jgi:competence protein ComFB|nr:late competence development ComFB family protein [Treponema sp.]